MSNILLGSNAAAHFGLCAGPVHQALCMSQMEDPAGVGTCKGYVVVFQGLLFAACHDLWLVSGWSLMVQSVGGVSDCCPAMHQEVVSLSLTWRDAVGLLLSFLLLELGLIRLRVHLSSSLVSPLFV